MIKLGVKCLLIPLSIICVYLIVDVHGGGYSSAETMSPAVKTEQSKSWEKDPILPKDTVPYSYNLFLHPDLESGTFSGTVSIKVNVASPRNSLYLHADELEISSSEVYNENSSKIEVDSSFPYTQNQFWVITLKEDIVPGKYEIKLSFSGLLTGKIVGFYRSTYTNDEGNKRYIVSTKFEPTYARKAFPCFDEPSHKAEFTVHIVRPSGDNYFALSNMNQVNEKEDSPSAGLTTVSFAPTPPMSTYLACFIVCDFEHLEPVYTSQGTPITVYARPGMQNRTEFSRNVAKKAMNYFIDYFDLEYPLPKIDLIGVPDFVSGAMENWGLITFRETSLLISPEDSVTDKEGTAGTVTHELAHMWFGNLVTMQWWDDLWLNEGFATFMAQKVVDIIEKDLFSNIDFVLGSLQSVLEEDAAEASHPIIQPVNHPDQITEIFDVISYSKGSSVIQMVENFQPENFKKGIRTYLKKYKFKNALTENLWAELNETLSTNNTERMLNSWTKQKGFPLVTVNKEGDRVTLTQQKCLKDAADTYNPADSPYHYKWDIPLTYITDKSPSAGLQKIFPSDASEITIDVDSNTKWFKLNFQQQGFFRVNYSREHWLSFIPLLDTQEIQDPLDRANLIDDAFSLARAGYLDYEIPFRLISYLKPGKEQHYAVWLEASKYFNRYKNILHGTKAYDKLMALGAKLLRNMITADIWEVNNTSSNLEKLLRSTLLSFSCRMEIPEVLARANEIFVNWIDGKTSKPNSSVRSLVYKYGLRGSNESVYRKKVWNIYLNESDPLERTNFMGAIASVSNPEMMAELLELMKDENNVRSQDYFIFISYMCLTPEGGEFVWNYLRKNWSYYVKRFTLNHRSLGLVLPKAVTYFSTEEKLKEVEDFIKENPEAGAGAAGRRKALETIKNNIKWHKQYYKNIEKTLIDIDL